MLLLAVSQTRGNEAGDKNNSKTRHDALSGSNCNRGDMTKSGGCGCGCGCGGGCTKPGFRYAISHVRGVARKNKATDERSLGRPSPSFLRRSTAKQGGTTKKTLAALQADSRPPPLRAKSGCKRPPDRSERCFPHGVALIEAVRHRRGGRCIRERIRHGQDDVATHPFPAPARERLHRLFRSPVRRALSRGYRGSSGRIWCE